MIKMLFDKVIRRLGIMVALAAAVWVIGGHIYNYCSPQSVRQEIQLLANELIRTMNDPKYTISEAMRVRGRAVVSKSVYVYITVEQGENEEDVVFEDLKNHMSAMGWRITEQRSSPPYFLQAESDEYIIRIDCASTKDHMWRATFLRNDFLSRYNL